jgi:hypothetical protein
VQPARVPVSPESLAARVVTLARAWSRGDVVGRLLGSVARARLSVGSRVPARSRRAPGRHASWQLASAVQSRSPLATVVLAFVVPVMALAAFMMAG